MIKKWKINSLRKVGSWKLISKRDIDNYEFIQIWHKRDYITNIYEGDLTEIQGKNLITLYRIPIHVFIRVALMMGWDKKPRYA